MARQIDGIRRMLLIINKIYATNGLYGNSCVSVHDLLSYISDLHDENVIKTPNDNLIVIDADIRLNTPELNRNGKYEINNSIISSLSVNNIINNMTKQLNQQEESLRVPSTSSKMSNKEWAEAVKKRQAITKAYESNYMKNL